jgi:hypothetical protein
MIDTIGSPARERRDFYDHMFSLSSRSGLHSEIVVLYVSEFVAAYSKKPDPRTIDSESARNLPPFCKTVGPPDARAKSPDDSCLSSCR